MRLKAGGSTAPEWAVDRKRQQDRQAVTNPVADGDRGVAREYSYVNMQAEGEPSQKRLLIQLRQGVIARLAGDDLVFPVRKGVSSAPGEKLATAGTCSGDPAQLRLEVAPEGVDVWADLGTDLHTTGMELSLDRTV